MSDIDKLIWELRTYIDNHTEQGRGQLAVIPTDGLNEILSRAEAEQGDEGLRLRLLTIANDGCGCECCEIIRKELNKVIDNIPTPTPDKDEPLAVLADRFSYSVEIHNNDGAEDDYWNIILDEVGLGLSNTKLFQGPTYFAAEQKAREYLNSLPDFKGGK